MIYPENLSRSLEEHKFAFLEVIEEGHTMSMTLNRSQKKNAMNPTLMREICFALSYAKYNPNIWAIVLRARGDVFCAGADLKAFAGKETETGGSTIPELEGEILLGDAFNQVFKPCIAVVDAPVYAGGFLLLCGCQYVICSDKANFSLPEARRGIFPMQVMQSLMNILPPRKLLDLCISGRKIDATEARDLGIVTHYCPKSEILEDQVLDILNLLFQNSPAAIRLGLTAYHELKSIPPESSHAFLKLKLNEILQTEDAKEGLNAFIEKRSPNWTGK